MIPTLPKLEGYVIYNPTTGLYSKGGSYGVWSKRPKIWSSIGAVKNHLVQYVSRDYTNYEATGKATLIITNHYKGAVVLNVADGSEPFNIHDYMKKHAETKSKYYGDDIRDEMV